MEDNNSTLFEFTESYQPENFLHREEQVNKISNTFLNFKKIGYGDNLLVSGTTGSGKTAIINKIITQQDNSLYVSCIEHNTSRKIFSFLTKANKKDPCETLEILVSQLKKTKKTLILDEIHRIKDIETFMSFLNHIYKETGCPVIVITNDFHFMNKVPEDAKLTLFFQKVQFFSYTPQQLVDILKDRLDVSHNKMPEGIITYICAKVVKDYFGSARIILDLARKCLINNKFTEEFVNSVINQININETETFIKNLSKSEQSFLDTILEISRTKEEILVSDIQKETKLSQARISQLVTSLSDGYGILKYTFRGGGKKGRYRVVSFLNEMDKYQFYKALHPECDEDKLNMEFGDGEKK